MPAGGLPGSSELQRLGGASGTLAGPWLWRPTSQEQPAGHRHRGRVSRWLGLGSAVALSQLTCQEVIIAQKPLLWSGSEILAVQEQRAFTGEPPCAGPSFRTVLLPRQGLWERRGGSHRSGVGSHRSGEQRGCCDTCCFQPCPGPWAGLPPSTGLLTAGMAFISSRGSLE